MKFIVEENCVAFSGKATILVNSCDSYSDVRDLFFKALQEYWPDNPFPVIINTESNPMLGYNEDEKAQKAWGERLVSILNKIETPYVIMLFDDFVLEDTVDQAKVDAALNILENDSKSSVFYLNAACVKSHKDEPEKDYRLLKDNVDYRLNSVPSIWKRLELLEFTKPIDNPWSWEVFGSYRTYNKNKNFYSASSNKKNIFKYNYKKGGAIYRGKWVKQVVEPKIKKYDLNMNLDYRGCVNLNEKVGRSFGWKMSFIFLGFRSIGFDMCKFVFRYCRSKVKGVGE